MKQNKRMEEEAPGFSMIRRYEELCSLLDTDLECIAAAALELTRNGKLAWSQGDKGFYAEIPPDVYMSLLLVAKTHGAKFSFAIGDGVLNEGKLATLEATQHDDLLHKLHDEISCSVLLAHMVSKDTVNRVQHVLAVLTDLRKDLTV